MGEDKAGGDNKSRDENSGRYVSKTSTREILDTFERLSESNIPTSDLKEELGYETPGAIQRLEKDMEYLKREDLGHGNPTLWSLRHTRSDFLEAFDTLGDLTPTEEIADHLECPEEVALEWLYKLKDEGQVGSHTRGEDMTPLWSKIED